MEIRKVKRVFLQLKPIPDFQLPRRRKARKNEQIQVHGAAGPESEVALPSLFFGGGVLLFSRRLFHVQVSVSGVSWSAGNGGMNRSRGVRRA